MKYIIKLIIVITFSIFSFSQKENYDFSCFEEDLIDFFIGASSEVEKSILNSTKIKIEIEDEIKVGEKLLKEQQGKLNFITSGKDYSTLQNITKSLNKSIQNPRGFKYQTYLVNTDDIFAFTAGGKIFYSTGLLRIDRDTSIIASIIGHEIAHNELYHINDVLKKQMILNEFETVGEIIGGIASFLTVSLNQKDEIHCDFYGIDLAFKAGYVPCSLPSFWNRMARLSETREGLFKFISSHPDSKKRKSCLKNHIKNNYQIYCK